MRQEPRPRITADRKRQRRGCQSPSVTQPGRLRAALATAACSCPGCYCEYLTAAARITGSSSRCARNAASPGATLSGPGRESVAPVQPDEPGQGEQVPPLQPGCGPLEQHHLLAAARPDWLYQAAADPELGRQRRGDLRERGGDQDGIVGGTLGQSAAAVAGEHLRVADALPGQVPPRLVRQV